MLLEAYSSFLELSPYSAWSAWLLGTLDTRWPEVASSGLVGDQRALGISAITVVIGYLPATLALCATANCYGLSGCRSLTAYDLSTGT
jgi:hypothetical protein